MKEITERKSAWPYKLRASTVSFLKQERNLYFFRNFKDLWRYSKQIVYHNKRNETSCSVIDGMTIWRWTLPKESTYAAFYTQGHLLDLFLIHIESWSWLKDYSCRGYDLYAFHSPDLKAKHTVWVIAWECSSFYGDYCEIYQYHAAGTSILHTDEKRCVNIN